MYYSIFEIKYFRIAAIGNNEGLKKIIFLSKSEIYKPKDKILKNDAFFKDAKRQLQEYFSGDRKSFDLKLAPNGSPFQQSVWQALLEIPYGETVNYLDIAIKINNPNACRAVGNANGKNPLHILIPCHRVILKSGKIGGYSAGVEIKKDLLQLEKLYT